MQEVNLYSPNGYALNYPHHTKWHNSKVWIVTNPSSAFTKGDIIFEAQESKNPSTGEMVYAFIQKKHIITEIVETRKARGNHLTDFEPIFQLVKVQRISE